MTLRPPVHRGLETLGDRSAFETSVPLLAASVPAQRCSQIMKDLGSAMISYPGIARIVPDTTDPSRRLLLLREQSANALSPDARTLLDAEGATFQPHTLRVDYSHWNTDEILRAILPEDLLDEVPSSFATVGHIAHLNLRDEYLPHRHLIAQVLLDKNPHIKTVVNKLDTIHHAYRFFDMEVLAGEDNLNVEMIEHGLRYRFNFAQVYWNTRLSTEHARLVELFKSGEVIVDAFAGVGPFAMPAAQKGCFVFASDLNPASASSLADNVKLNHLEGYCRCGNADGRDYIKSATLEAWDHPFAHPPPRPSARQRGKQRAAPAPVLPAPSRLVGHYVMNLPDSALSFLDAYRGLYVSLLDRPEFDIEAAQRSMPMVHCYCFSKHKTLDQAIPDICARATESFGSPVNADALEDFAVSLVRDVAPNKAMYRLDFRLPWAVVVGE